MMQDEDAMDEVADEITEDDVNNEKRVVKELLSADKFLLTPRRLGQLEAGAFASISSSSVASVRD